MYAGIFIACVMLVVNKCRLLSLKQVLFCSQSDKSVAVAAVLKYFGGQLAFNITILRRRDILMGDRNYTLGDARAVSMEMTSPHTSK